MTRIVFQIFDTEDFIEGFRSSGSVKFSLSFDKMDRAGIELTPTD